MKTSLRALSLLVGWGLLGWSVATAQTDPVPGAAGSAAGAGGAAGRVSPQQPAQPQRNEQQVKEMIDRVMQQLDQLIPGEFAEGSEVSAALRGVVETFAKREFEPARTKLNEICAANPTLPPAGLLWSALLLAANDGNSAYQALEQAAVESPEYPGIYVALARMALGGRRFADAWAQIQETRRAIDAGTWNDEQKKHLETDYLDTIAEIASNREQLDQARGYLEELRSKYLPESAMVLIRLADLDFRQDKVEQALQQLTAARALDADNVPVPELTLFEWYLRAGKTAEAKEWIEKAVAQHADDRHSQYKYGEFLLQTGNPGEAAVWIEKAEKSGYDPDVIRLMRGQIAYYRGAFSAAEADFKELNSRRPNDFLVRNMLALSLIESSEPARKQNALDMALSNFNSNQNVYAASTLAWIQYRLGNQKAAQQLFSQVINQANVPTDSAFYVAHLFADEGRYEQALTLLNQALTAPGLFLNRMRAEEFVQELQKRQQQTAPKPENEEKSGG